MKRRYDITFVGHVCYDEITSPAGETSVRPGSAYLARRKTHPPTEALRFAAALASIKMETPGPFAGTLADVEERMKEM